MGAKTGDGMSNHHLIPEELMKRPDFSAMFKKLKSMGFDGDGASNGTFLPGSSKLAMQLGQPGHWSNHSQYTQAIEGRLQGLNQLWQRGRLSDIDLPLGIKNIQNWAENALQKNQLFNVDPITGRLL